MGRAKSNMELIKKEKLRNNTFQQRNNSLKKKVYELATLCDIKAAVITYGPKKATPQAHPIEPEIWPQNRDEVLELINKYKSQSPEDRKTRTSLLSDFFKERIKTAQQALTKQRHDNVQSKYPTWHARFDSMKEEDLRNSVGIMENVLGNARARLERMKATNIYHTYQVQQQQQQQANNIHHTYQVQQQQQQMMLSNKRKLNFDEGNQASKYPKIQPHQTASHPVGVPFLMPFPIQQQRLPSVNHNWNQMMVMFGNEYAGGTSNIVHNTPMLNAVCNYPMMAGTPDSVSYGNNLARAPPLNGYGEGRQPIIQHVMEYRPLTEGSNFHQTASNQYCGDRKPLGR